MSSATKVEGFRVSHVVTWFPGNDREGAFRCRWGGNKGENDVIIIKLRNEHVSGKSSKAD